MNAAMRSRLMTALAGDRNRRWRHALADMKRRVLFRPHVLTCFLELDDPYSWLLAHYLPALQSSFDIKLEIRVTQALSGGYRPRPDMLAEYAAEDCSRVALELGVPFLDKGAAPPVEHRRAMLEYLAGREHDSGFDDEVLQALELYWRGDNEGTARRVAGVSSDEAAAAMLRRNSQLLEKLGHYNCATIFYGGDWYWSVDRLGYLIERLTAAGARRDDKLASELVSLQQLMRFKLPVAPPTAARKLPPLELFFSFRSPYSWLSLQRYMGIGDAFGLQVVLRPVLPMMMRGMQVPRNKAIYIIRDAAREARRNSIPFGKAYDPLGAGVERCHAAFAYACREKRERDFALAAGEAIWSLGIDVSSDEGLRLVTDRAGLFWPDVVKAIEDEGWRETAEANRESMMASGCWGVPTVRLGDYAVWGQDRDWLLVRHLEELCDSGDGILV